METAKEYYRKTRSVDTNIWTLTLVMNFADEYADQFKKQLKEKEEEIERLKKVINDDSDYKAMRNYAKELEYKLGINPNSKK